MLAKLFGVNGDPIHWLFVGVLLICISFGVYNRILASELAECKVSEKGVEIVGKAQNKEAKKEDKESKENKEKVDEEYRKYVDSLRADNERLRKQVTRTRSLPSAPQTCTGGSETTEVNWPDVERAIDDYRLRVRSIVEKGDKERKGLDTVKEWVDKEIDD